MSNRVRRMLAIVCCVALGAAVLPYGTAMLSAAQLPQRALGVILLILAGFFFLSAIGLLRPWIPRPPRP
jgi:hypothetical protein